jgi:hypothetical protein
MSCPSCFRGSIHTNAKPPGSYSILHGLKTYIASPATTTSTTTSTSKIILLIDAFGFNLPNSFLLADHYASTTGYTVLTSLRTKVRVFSDIFR